MAETDGNLADFLIQLSVDDTVRKSFKGTKKEKDAFMAARGIRAEGRAAVLARDEESVKLIANVNNQVSLSLTKAKNLKSGKRKAAPRRKRTASR